MNESTSPRTPRRRFPPTAASVRAARAFVDSVLEAERVSAPSLSTLRLVVSELVANAIQHGEGTLDVEVALDLSDDDWLQLAVTSGANPHGAMPDVPQWTIAPPDATSGRGLGIVRELVDEVSSTAKDGVVAVRCRVHR